MSRTVTSPSLLFGLLLATTGGLRAEASISVLRDVCNGGCKGSSALGYVPHPLNGRRSFRAEGAHCCERHADDARRVVHLLRGGAAGPSISDHSHKVVSLRGSNTPSTTTLAKDTNLSHAIEPLVAPGNESPDVEALEGAVLRQGDRSISLKGLPETRAGLGAAEKVRGGLVTDIISRAFRIDKPELKKFLCMSSMMFAIIYIFTMTRDTKDALVVTNCGAEAIAFLKVYAVLPAAAMFMLGYNWLSNQVSSRALFHLTITPFLAFYAIFAFVMYPMRGILHHAGGAMGKDEHMFSHMINLGRFWMFSLYYVVSELWGSAGVPLLFWTCANEVTPISQAKRFYPMFAILGNLAPIASGQTMAYVSRHRDKTMDADAVFQRTLKVLSSFILCAGGVIMVLYEMVMAMTDRAAESSGAESTTRVGRKDKLKPKMSLMESFRFLSKSKYLGYVGLMVVSYGLAMEFTEIVWKAIVKLAYPDKSDYMAFMGQYSTIVGATTFVMLLIGKEVIKYMGWEAGALATPLMMTLLAIPFFGYIMLGNIQQSRKTLMQALWVGMIQNVLSKATKYALFDPTKEMSYIPLDKESKVKGKAAIDVLGARLGKSGGALAQQGLVVACGSILTGAPVLATLFGLVSVMWITSVLNLSKLFKVKQAEAEEAAAKPEER